MAQETIFSKIVRGELPSTKVYEDNSILAFKDINPSAKIDIIVIPKSNHLERLSDMQSSDVELLGNIMLKIKQIATDLKLDKDGYRVITNSGDFAGQEVPHLHFHILGGEKLKDLN
ncbi:MAG: histidine triad nucleotide-binding protein [Proteobacteria bacterium]|nr:histidine triad nucleotide-binding protein [Pseudomonadota bacterium]